MYYGQSVRYFDETQRPTVFSNNMYVVMPKLDKFKLILPLASGRYIGITIINCFKLPVGFIPNISLNV